MYRSPLFILCFLVVSSAAAVCLFHGPLLKWTVAAGAERTLGLRVEMEGIALRLSKGEFHLTGVTVRGPRGFEDEAMIAARTVHVEVDLRSLLRSRPHIRRVYLDIPAVTVVRNEAGVVNFEEVGRNARGRASERGTAPKGEGPAEAGATFIDLAVIRLETVTYRDYAGGTPPFAQSYAVPVSEIQYHDVAWEDIAAGFGFLAAVGRSGPGPLIRSLSRARGAAADMEKVVRGIGESLQKRMQHTSASPR